MTNPINTSGLNIGTIYSGTKLTIFAVIASWAAPSNNSFNDPEKNVEAQQLSLQHEIYKKKSVLVAQ